MSMKSCNTEIYIFALTIPFTSQVMANKYTSLDCCNGWAEHIEMYKPLGFLREVSTARPRIKTGKDFVPRKSFHAISLELAELLSALSQTYLIDNAMIPSSTISDMIPEFASAQKLGL